MRSRVMRGEFSGKKKRKENELVMYLYTRVRLRRIVAAQRLKERLNCDPYAIKLPNLGKNKIKPSPPLPPQICKDYYRPILNKTND